jgi:hypothetical protein
MGFYFEMLPHGAPSDGPAREYAEIQTPPVFWVLYLIGGFALLCMGLAANRLLYTLVREGNSFDRFVVSLIFFAVPLYLLIGIRFSFVRKYIAFNPEDITFGFRLGNNLSWPIWTRRIPRGTVADIDCINQRPTANLAPKRHDDSQYYIRGHWRVGVVLKNGKFVTLDRHTEKEALAEVFQSLKRWFGSNDVDE